MQSQKCAAVILAAGQGTRMKSALPKVLHEIAGQPLVAWPVEQARLLGCEKISIVVGHGSDSVRNKLGAGDLQYAVQTEQLGTGHALLSAEASLSGFNGTVLLLCGDVPLLRQETLQQLLDLHHAEEAMVTVLTAQVNDPYGYGRIIRDGKLVQAIVEEKDATAEQKTIREINSGIYAFAAPYVFDALRNVGRENAQGEYYLTDIIAAASADGHTVRALQVESPEEVHGINDRIQLAAAARTIRQRLNAALMRQGVSMIDPETTYVDVGVQIGSDTILYPNVSLRGRTLIGRACIIEPGAVLTDCEIGDRVHIKPGSVLAGSKVGDDGAIGPMAHLRPGTILDGDNKIGNFVETKKAHLGIGSQASHLTYLGDAEVGRNVNFGCGTITCNYDGRDKHLTVVEDDVFVGSDTQFIAPVRIGRNSLIAAGSTITKDVPADSLAIARSEQRNIEGWAKEKKKSKK
ncbi:MAG: bifunctional UDP-N-acetylglucosamine diphosphorylase/glucosamine-1-phosphate N-acetyltransferase GlmU [Desulfuromonadales bacterium]|nr:bifunctional UDP-N-acetylglucosamine diphosphorylase/glucosamine-1-phosphate N-acetyltransferase GlmU [Desulfuromonadales bacterium]